MKQIVKIVLGVLLGIVLLALVIVVDSAARSRLGGPMKIEGLPISNSSVMGTWKPDFLWTGRAWRIDVQSDENLELQLDGRKYVVPKGFHTVYSNHDHTNTKQYGDQEFWGYPERVEIRTLD